MDLIVQKIQKLLKKLPDSVYLFIKYKYFFILFVADYFKFKSQAKKSGIKISWKNRYPELKDKTTNTNFDQHYIYHPAWAARIVKEINPEFHIDISSTVSFCTMLSAFIPVKFYDFRPARIFLNNLTSETADLTSLHFPSNSIKSLSCMHTVEHVGLGRYGDSIDVSGDIKAINELRRVTAPGGNLLLVVPIGKPSIRFNAHRIYSYKQIISYFPEFRIMNYTLIPDNSAETGIICNSDEDISDRQTYGCGCFWLKKT